MKERFLPKVEIRSPKTEQLNSYIFFVIASLNSRKITIFALILENRAVSVVTQPPNSVYF
jgi:hypothetical protein